LFSNRLALDRLISLAELGPSGGSPCVGPINEACKIKK